MSLQVWLPLINDNSTQGLMSLSATNLGTVSYISGGKFGKCLSAGTGTQTTNGISYNNNLVDALGTNFSCSIWVRPLGNHVHYNGTFISSGDWNKKRWAFGVSQDNTKVDVFCAGHNVYLDCTVPVNEWTHLVSTANNGIIKLYKNGQYVGQTIRTDTTLLSDASNFCVGRETYASGYFSFNGNITDIRIYDHTLSVQEVKELSKGLVCHYPLDNNGNGGDNIIPDTSPNEVQYTYPSSSYSDRFYKTSTVVPSASQYILSFWAKSTNSGDKVRAHWYSPNTTTGAETSQGATSAASDGRIEFTLSDQWEKYWCVWTQSSTTAVKHLIFPRMFSQASGQATGTGTVSVKCVKLEEGNQPTAWCPNSADQLYSSLAYNSTFIYDCSGFGHTGIISGGLTISSDTPRYSISTKFDTSQHINTTIEPTGYTNSYTFAWWGKFGNCNGHMMWGFANGNRLNLYCYSNNCYWNTGNGTSNPFNVPMSPYLDSKFHHFAVTGDGTTAKLYIDGEFKANATTYQGITGTNLYFNGWAASSSYNFNGSLSDFRLYATALSAEDIQQLYNAPVSVSNNGAMFTQGEFVET